MKTTNRATEIATEIKRFDRIAAKYVNSTSPARAAVERAESIAICADVRQAAYALVWGFSTGRLGAEDAPRLAKMTAKALAVAALAIEPLESNQERLAAWRLALGEVA